MVGEGRGIGVAAAAQGGQALGPGGTREIVEPFEQACRVVAEPGRGALVDRQSEQVLWAECLLRGVLVPGGLNAGEDIDGPVAQFESVVKVTGLQTGASPSLAHASALRRRGGPAPRQSRV
jgi:hypothetical protein